MRGSTETELQVGPVRTTDPDPLTQSLSALSSPAADRSEETSLKHKDQKNMSHHTHSVWKSGRVPPRRAELLLSLIFNVQCFLWPPGTVLFRPLQSDSSLFAYIKSGSVGEL